MCEENRQLKEKVDDLQKSLDLQITSEATIGELKARLGDTI